MPKACLASRWVGLYCLYNPHERSPHSEKYEKQPKHDTPEQQQKKAVGTSPTKLVSKSVSHSPT